MSSYIRSKMLRCILKTNADRSTAKSLFCQRYFARSKSTTDLPLSPQDVSFGIDSLKVSNILKANEYTMEFPGGSVKSFDSNSLPSNNPIEDTRCESQCLLTNGYLFGIFDGHGGPACAQVLSKRLLQYIAASLLPSDVLQKYLNSTHKEDLILRFNDKTDLVEDIKPIYEKSFQSFLELLHSDKIRENTSIKSAMELAFKRMDSDLSDEVLSRYEKTGKIDKRLLSVAISGAVSCVAHVDGPHLHVANVGDTCAVLGVLTENNEWVPKKLSMEHNTDNLNEVDRIISEHPESEKETVLKFDRLLGQLAPLRSLGDFRYKWSLETMKDIIVKYVGPHAVPPNYQTPPYLSGVPEITYHQLTPKDKFMVIASDGLWDILTPLQVVTLAGEHMLGKVFFTPLKLSKKDIKLGEINHLLLHRREGLKMKPEDNNVATHLMRHALGGTDYGIEHAILAEMLSLPPDISRSYRDDITITVIFFDTDYLRQYST